MSKPTQSIFPLENARLTTNLDCNNLQLVNLDESNLSGGGGGGGNDTGTTTAILKGDGNHGFADAVAGTDYATTGAVAVKEDTATHDADILTLTTAVDLTEADIVTLTTAVGTKASTTALTDGLALKADDADLQAYITSNDADVALKAYITDVDTALALKASTSSVTTGLALKEDLLPITANDGYVLVRDTDDTWRFVDPVTLGTTSQTFTDGQEHSSTTFNSATAAFVSTDIGKTITGTNIPAATTIASVTNATTVILSAAATATASGITFTIINRLLTNNTGTVTSVSLTNNVTGLFTSSVSNPTSSPTITLTALTNVGANTFYGNFTGFASTAGFGTASAARTSLGGTTVGQALFQLANPSAITFLRVNADNTVTARSAANMLLDLGAENALTFSTPLTRSVSTNIIGIQAATASQSGYITSTDWNNFNGKPPGTRTIATTAPLTGGGNLTADRTIAMPAATLLADGYLTLGDFTSFTNKPPNSRTISTTAPLSGGGDLSANRTLSMLSATVARDGYLAASDFASFANQVPVIRQAGVGGTLTLADVSPPITRVILNTALTSPLVINLPQSVGYGNSIGFPFIEIVDVVQGGAQTIANGVTVNRTAGANNDLIDNATSITLPRGIGYLRINSNGLNRWSTTKYFVDSIKDAADASRQVRVVLPATSSNFPTATIRTLTLANLDSVTVAPSTAQTGQVVRGVGTDGNLQTSSLRQTEIVPVEQTMADTDTSVTNDGSVDTIKIGTVLTATRSYTLPNVTLYSSGEFIRFYDSTGNPNNQTARVRAASGETINGLPSIDVNQGAGQNFNRTFVADPVGLNWTAETLPGSTASGLIIDPWHTVVAGSSTTLTCTSGVTENHHIVTMSAPTTLIFNGVTNGQTGLIKFRDTTGSHLVTVPAGIAKTPTAGGVGVFTTSAGAPIEDLYHWSFDNTNYTFVPLGLNLAAASLPDFTTKSDDTTGVLSSDGVVKQGNTASHKFIAARVVADGLVSNGSTYTVGKVQVVLTKNATGGSTNLTLNCYSDTLSNSPLSPMGSSASVAVSTITTPEQVVDFSANFNLTGARAVTSLTTLAGNATITGVAGQFLAGDVGCKVFGTNIPVNARITAVAVDGSTATLATGTGVTANAGGATVTVKHVYWIVLTGDNASANTTNNISWHYHTVTSDPLGIWWRQPVGGPWAAGDSLAGPSQLKYILYK